MNSVTMGEGYEGAAAAPRPVPSALVVPPAVALTALDAAPAAHAHDPAAAPAAPAVAADNDRLAGPGCTWPCKTCLDKWLAMPPKERRAVTKELKVAAERAKAKRIRKNPDAYKGRTVGGSYQLWQADLKRNSRYVGVRSGRNAPEMQKALSKIWHGLSEEDKAPYEERVACLIHPHTFNNPSPDRVNTAPKH